MKKKMMTIEYFFLLVMFLAVLDSVFIGFSAIKYRFVFMACAMIFLVLSQLLFRIHKSVLYLYLLWIVGYVIMLHQWLFNGFYLIYNRIVQQINSIYDMGFFYYIDASIEHSQRDILVFLCALLFLLNLCLYLCRKHMGIFVAAMSVLEFMILVLTPYHIISIFFLYLAALYGYIFIRQRQRILCVIGCAVFCAAMVSQMGSLGNQIGDLSVAKEQAIETVRDISQGNDYVVSGGIGEGDMRGIQNASPKGIRLFTVTTQSKNTLYLKGFVSGTYKDNHWNRANGGVFVLNGNNAISLPYLFFDLHMSDFSVPSKEDKLVENETTLKFQYHKLNDKYYLWPYFSDIEANSGTIYGDLYVTRSNLPRMFSLTYFPMKSTKEYLNSEIKLKDSENMSSIEQNYKQSMKDYNQKVKEDFLYVPAGLRKNISKEFPKLKEQKTLLQKVTYVQELLQNHYTYSYKQKKVPKNQDSIWYFLHQSKTGYCVQYASSAVMMYRMMGIPTRYVEGYKIDQSYFKNNNKVDVTDRFAHAWPEVYIKNVGWVPIEVTNVTRVPATNRSNKNLVLSPTQTKYTKILNCFNQMKTWVMLVTIVLFLIHYIIYILHYIRLSRKTNKEKVVYYYDVVVNQYGVDTAQIKDSREMEIFLKAKYSPYDITKEEYNIIKRYVHILRKKL